MTCWLIRQSYPGESINEILTSTSEVEISKDLNTIYTAVSRFEKNAFPIRKKGIKRRKLIKKTALKNILNIHNDDGIRDLAQLKKNGVFLINS